MIGTNHGKAPTIMGISPANTESQKHMSDVAMARDYVRDIGGKGAASQIISRAFDRLADMFPHREEPRNRWTERRVRSFWNREAAVVQFREMVELHRAAEQAKSERKLLEQARKEHAAFIEKTASLAALLERQDEAFHSPQIEGLRGICGGVGRAGTEG